MPLKRFKLVSVLLAASALFAGTMAAGQAITSSFAGLQIEVRPADIEGFQVKVSPAGTQNVANLSPLSINSQGGESTFAIDPESSSLIVRTKGSSSNEPTWSGSVQPLDVYGRAVVPGLELRWNVPGKRITQGVVGRPLGIRPRTFWEGNEIETIYGLGERFSGLDQFGKRVAMWIRDEPGQSDDKSVSYFCAPVLYSSRGYALFAMDNPEGDFDLNQTGDGTHHYRRAGTSMTFYIVTGPSLKDLVLARGRLQGPFRRIPDWAWGPWISRNSFENQGEAESVLHEMIQRHWPVSAIVQEAWKGRGEEGDFNSYSTERWPVLDRYFALCKKNGIRTILWQVPLAHPQSPDFAEISRKGFLVKAPDGSPSLRGGWMEGFAHIDFTDPHAVAYWKDQMRDEVRKGVWGFKSDDGENIKADDVFADGRHGWQMHNEYVTLYQKALTELLEEEGVDGVLWSRSGSLGSERFPAMWAGDQYAKWDQFRSLLPAGLSASLSGMPFWGHDIGGYIGTPTPELYIRWLQFGAFSPMMQYHGIEPREPWNFGKEAERAYALLSQLRMNLRPTLIALGDEAARTGMPIMRPMIMEFPGDARFRSEDSQYMLGPDLLVAPVVQENVSGRRIKFPQGTWQNLLLPIAYEGPSEYDVPIDLMSAPVFVREGARLKMELDKHDHIGSWRPRLSVRELSYDAGRAMLRNVRFPLSASAQATNVLMTFGVSPRLSGEWDAAWLDANGHVVRNPPVVRNGDLVTINLSTNRPPVEAGTKQTLIIKRKGMALDEGTLFRGSVKWE